VDPKLRRDRNREWICRFAGICRDQRLETAREITSSRTSAVPAPVPPQGSVQGVLRRKSNTDDKVERQVHEHELWSPSNLHLSFFSPSLSPLRRFDSRPSFHINLYYTGLGCSALPCELGCNLSYEFSRLANWTI